MADRTAWDPAPTTTRAGRSGDRSQARRLRPDSRPSDLRRLLTATASSVLPGTGQALNGRRRPALIFGVPTAIAIVVAWLIARSDQPAIVLARLVTPTILGLLLVFNVVVLGWRLAALAQAFVDGRYPGRPGRLGAIGLALLIAFTILPHAVAWRVGSAAQTMFGQVFAGSDARSVSTNAVIGGQRYNVLLIGVDSGPGRTESLTDSLIVVSLDPIGRTVSMVSIPRDLASVPLGDGSTFGPKINSLMSYADSHRDTFPNGGIPTLEGAVGALLGIHVDAYAKVDLEGFVAMVDAVGGVDINVKKGLADPKYPNLDGTHGWSIEAGPHHLNGTDALAYARIRKVVGESDLTRAMRQQEVLVALRNRAVTAGVLLNLPALLEAVGTTVRTNLPQDALPELAAFAELIGGNATVKVVLTSPMIKGASGRYGSVWLPVPSRIAQMTKVVFGPPGGNPTWPVPKSSPSASSAGTVAIPSPSGP